MASAVARAYNGCLPSGSRRGRAPGEGSGAKPPVQGGEPLVMGHRDEKLFLFARPAKATNLSYFLFICSILHVQAWNDFSAQ